MDSRSQTPSTQSTSGSTATPAPPRLFLHEPGWSVALKVGSERTFCYQMAPGQDYYHRLLDGEIYVHHGDERLCLACAQRRGLLTSEPKALRTPVLTLELTTGPGEDLSEFEIEFPTDPLQPGEGKPAR
jgi:hypothetical protein